jgi:hypothetical protein
LTNGCVTLPDAASRAELTEFSRRTFLFTALARWR